MKKIIITVAILYVVLSVLLLLTADEIFGNLSGSISAQIISNLFVLIIVASIFVIVFVIKRVIKDSKKPKKSLLTNYIEQVPFVVTDIIKSLKEHNEDLLENDISTVDFYIASINVLEYKCTNGKKYSKMKQFSELLSEKYANICEKEFSINKKLFKKAIKNRNGIYNELSRDENFIKNFGNSFGLILLFDSNEDSLSMYSKYYANSLISHPSYNKAARVAHTFINKIDEEFSNEIVDIRKYIV